MPAAIAATSEAQFEYAAPSPLVTHVEPYSVQKAEAALATLPTHTPPPLDEACGQWTDAPPAAPEAATDRWYARQPKLSPDTSPVVPAAMPLTSETQFEYAAPWLLETQVEPYSVQKSWAGDDGGATHTPPPEADA